MKILHVIHSGGLYGAERMLLNLIHEQERLGLNASVASIGEGGTDESALDKEVLKRGIPLVKFPMGSGPGFAGAFRILEYARQRCFHVLHSHGYKPNILIGFTPKRFRRIPFVTTLHGWTSGDAKLRFYEWLDSKSIRYIDAVVVVSKAMLDNPRLRKHKRSNIHVINNGIPSRERSAPFVEHGSDSDAHDRLDQEILNFCRTGYTVGSIGRLSREKGYNHLLEAIHLLVRKGLEIRLVIIGEGPERKRLTRLASDLQIQSRVFLPGYRQNAHLYLPSFNLFVLSSLSEGLPMTLMEAMQARVPVAATNVGGIPEVLENGRAGLLVAPCNPAELARALQSIHQDTDGAASMTAYAYKRVNSTYSSQHMAHQYHEIYRLILSGQNNSKDSGTDSITRLDIRENQR